MASHLININSWEMIKGILGVWWLLAKELWWFFLILILIRVMPWFISVMIGKRKKYKK